MVLEQNHAEVKRLFFAALELPPTERSEFLLQACRDDQQLHGQVETLLKHHLSETILTVANEPKSGERRGGANVIGAATSSYMGQETRNLLQSRLQAVVVVLCIGMGYALLRYIAHPNTAAIAIRTFSFLAMLGCAVILWSRIPLRISNLRLLEIAVLMNVGIFGVVINIRSILFEASIGDVADVVGANAYNYHTWTLIILVYGTFMPNSWERAAAILVPCASIPYLVTFGVSLWSDSIANTLSQSQYGLPHFAPLLAVFTAIYAAHLIHSSRRDAYKSKQYAQYHLKRLIGAGGMGEVYEAEHLLLKRPCAIKLIHKERCSDPLALERFEREVRATASLTHPNTIEVFDYGQTTEGTFYYVMELLPGMSLSSLIEHHGPLEASRTIYLLRQVCRALQDAHDQKLIHRDIKPANIFAAERGGMYDFAKLLDFGLVRHAAVDSPSELSGVNTIGGTPHYMAPEQATAYSDADARSDIYSLGCVAYHLATGRTPFQGESSMGIILSQINDTVTPPSQLQTGLPSDLESVILRCLNKSPDDRYQSAAELESALAQCADSDKWSLEAAAQWWSNLPKTTENKP